MRKKRVGGKKIEFWKEWKKKKHKEREEDEQEGMGNSKSSISWWIQKLAGPIERGDGEDFRGTQIFQFGEVLGEISLIEFPKISLSNSHH